jgi:hypothetical protein
MRAWSLKYASGADLPARDTRAGRRHRGGHGPAAARGQEEAQRNQGIGHTTGTRAQPGVVKVVRKAMIMPLTWAGEVGAGEGNRTLMTSLEGWRSAIELRPRAPVVLLAQRPDRHRQRTGYRTHAPNR